jgi:PleD family two-component response regulator
MNKECLVIDDDVDDLEIFSMCVKALTKEVNCRTMSDPVEAISMLASSPEYTPDYIFIDMNMPKVNGIDCLKVLKNMGRLSYTRMYMYSTSAEGRLLDESKSLGATDYIVKPAKVTELKTKLSVIFEIVSNMDKDEV